MVLDAIRFIYVDVQDISAVEVGLALVGCFSGMDCFSKQLLERLV